MRVPSHAPTGVPGPLADRCSGWWPWQSHLLGCDLHLLGLGGDEPPVSFTSQRGRKAGIGRPGCCPIDLWFKSPVTRDGVWSSPRQFAHARVFLMANKAPPPPPPSPPPQHPVALFIYCLLELNMRCLNVMRGYGDHSPLTRPTGEVTHGGRRRRAGGCRWLGGGGGRGP
jgi:hypothetical protein